MDKDFVIMHIEGVDELVSFTVEISSAATILELKQKIQEKTGVTMDRQIIVDKDNCDPLRDNYTVRGCGFSGLAEVVLLALPRHLGAQINITISVPPGTDDFNLTVEDKQTVLQLKQKICSMGNNIGPETIQLYHFFTEMKDHEPLYKYFVNEGSKIIMLFN